MANALKLVFLAAAALLAGCSLAPDYVRPQAPVDRAWPQGKAYDGVKLKAGTLVGWQKFFSDHRLVTLIGMSLANNRDLRVASLNADRARAAYNISEADLLPTVGASMSVSDSRTPYGLSTFGRSYHGHAYQPQVGISSYEIDFFGKIRSQNESALQQFFAAEANVRAAQISLVAGVAAAWLNYGAQQDFIVQARTTYESQRASYRLIEKSYKLGAANESDLQRARTTVESARGDLTRAIRSAEQARNALVLLVGSSFDENLLPKKFVPAASALPNLPAGTPGNVLLNRPDIMAAEAQLKAANADIGAARAAFFPSVTLTGGVGKGGSHFTQLFSSGSGMWSFVPQINIPIFTGGRLTANLRATEASQKIAVANYEKAIQTAFREVADAMATEGTIDEEVASQKALTEAARRAYAIADSRYKQGLDSYLNVLDAQRSMVAAEKGLISVELSRANSAVTLYKVLGGGLNEPRDTGRKESAGKKGNKAEDLEQ